MSEELLQEEPTDDLRASIEAAFTADESAAPAEAAPAPEAGQPRAPDGKFAPKAEGVQAAASIPTDQPVVAAPEAPQEPIRPPASWSAQAKADFATLPQHIQQEVLKREGDVTKGFEDRAKQIQKYEPLEAVIAPHRSRIAMNGLSDAQYVGQLVAADELLRSNPIQGLAQVAQIYGIDLRQFAQPGAQGQQPQQAQLPPQFQQFAQEFDAFKQTFTQQQTAAEQAAAAQTQAEIDAFAKDHLYFENVKPAMAALLKTGQASDLESAYTKACRMDDAIFPLLQKDEADRKAQADKVAATARVTAARGASGSLTGSPAPGSAPARNGPAPSIRDSIAEAWDA